MKLYVSVCAVCLLYILLLSGCGKSSKPADAAAEEPENHVMVSVKQFEADSMKTGGLLRRNFEDEVNCNGYIVAPVNGIAQLSAPLSGIIASINCAVGDYVKKGQILGKLSSNELMVIQQEFTESSAKLKRLELDYRRSKSLYDEKIGAEKDFISIESEYKGMLSRYESLKLRLQLLKLDVTQIESGQLYAEFPLISPLNGHITSQHMILGRFVEQQQSLVEIIDVSQLQLELSVFENDISKLKIGQNIRFSTLGDKSTLHNATLTSISKTIDPESKTVRCAAKIKANELAALINRSYIEAQIAVNRKEADALPTEAILKSGKDYYVFIVEKSDNQSYYLRKQKVETGKASDGYTEISGISPDAKILVKGVYNLPVQ